ncbi:MAG: efflux RND transporter periplasmic adaptor subunit [Deltaproteobacteria bacterium]|nr:efflux RND transporter periplasmic adaptor subunit [Deltaproteobacteria bacterium]MBW2445870.1 efflux RND transporter periplasmic adaptor subunit [Deltaproteobacteria bacterium]
MASRAAAGLVLVLPLALACGDRDASREAEPSRSIPTLTIPVRTVAVERGEITQRILVPGSLVAGRESRIGAEVGGRIEEVFVREGDRVEADAPLFRVDPEPYDLALRQARAGRDLARAERRQIDSDLKRARDLRGKQVVAQQHVERLETQVAVARAHEAQAGERMRMAELDVRRTTVRAPFAGSVTKRLADEGTTALRQPQTIVIVLQETHELDGRATIPEAYMSAVRLGDRAVVSVAGHGVEIETEISAVSDAVDHATRTYEVRMRVPNADHALKAGVFAEITIHPMPRTGVLLVPREAIRSEEGRTRVLVFRDGVAVAVPVELGAVAPDSVEVRSGIEAGERVIVGEEAQTVAPGMAVRERQALAGPP